MYEDFKERGIRRTIISFDPFLKREDVRADRCAGRQEIRSGDEDRQGDAAASGRSL